MNRIAGVCALAACLTCLQFQAETRAEETTIRQHARWVTSVSVSQGLLAAGGGESLQYRPGDVTLWDLESGNQLATMKGHDANVWSVALSPDTKTLVSTGYDGTIIVWDVEQRKPRATLEKKGWCRSAAFAPDGAHFVTAQEDGQVTVWSTAEAKEVRTIKAHENQVFQVAFSPDGATLGTASGDKTAKLWNWQEGKETGKLEGHEDAVWSIAFSSTGLIATAGADRQVILWKDGAEQARLKGHKDWISQIAFSPDGAALASADQGRMIKIWDVASAAEAASIGPLGGSQWSVAFAPNGQLITGGRDACLRVWSLQPRRIYEVTDRFPEPPKEEEKPEDKKPEDKKPEDKKPEDKKPEDKKPEDKKPEDKKPEDKKPEDKKPEDKKPEDKKPEDKKPEDKKPEDKKPEDKKPEVKKPEKQ